MPLEFLRRRGGGSSATPDAPPEPAEPAPLPEESVAQEHALRLSFGAKTSAGVRVEGGPSALAGLPSLLSGLNKSPVEVVEPRVTSLAAASPNIVRPAEAAEWLRAHAEASPITRHALYVLETLDAIDLAYDTFAVALLDGDIDPAGYPEYAAIIGGVAAHWDEGTGDLIVRAVVGWGGRGARGDTDRSATRLLSRLFGNIVAGGATLGVASAELPAPTGTSVTCQHCGYPLVDSRAVFCPKCGMRMLHG